MWSETVGLRTRPVCDQNIGLGLARCGLGLAGSVSSRHYSRGEIPPEILNFPPEIFVGVNFERRSGTSCRYSCFFLRRL